jgi:DNA polymerase-3 subunit alpha
MLSDDTGAFECMMFSEVLAASRELLDSEMPLLLTLDAQLENDKVRLLATRVDALEKVLAAALRNLKIRVSPDLPIDQFQELIDQDGRGKGRIVLETRSNGHWIEVALQGTYAIQPKTLSGLKNLPGIVDMREF